AASELRARRRDLSIPQLVARRRPRAREPRRLVDRSHSAGCEPQRSRFRARMDAERGTRTDVLYCARTRTSRLAGHAVPAASARRHPLGYGRFMTKVVRFTTIALALASAALAASPQSTRRGPRR